jgi:hypothetical protein
MTGLSAYVAIAGGLFIALWKYPAVALAGVLCIFGLEQWGQATTTFFAQHHTATNYFIGGILVLALMAGREERFSLLAGYLTVGWLTSHCSSGALPRRNGLRAQTSAWTYGLAGGHISSPLLS